MEDDGELVFDGQTLSAPKRSVPRLETGEMVAANRMEGVQEDVVSLEELFDQLVGRKRYDSDLQKELFDQYLDRLIELLDRRSMTDPEIERYVLTGDPLFIRRSDCPKLVAVLPWNCQEKLVQLLAKLVERGHFAAVKTIVLEYSCVGPLWTEFSWMQTFQSEVVQKVPDWLYQQFKNTPPIIERTKREPWDANREAVGIFEPYDIVTEWRLVE
jgi:hypothetical protein